MVEEAAERESASTLPNFRDTPSLILNRDHPLSDLYYKKAPYKIYWGGRGSAKSWGFAEAVIRIMAERNCRVLCAREFQNSIKESVYELLKLTAERLGLSSWFDFTADRITARRARCSSSRDCTTTRTDIRSTRRRSTSAGWRRATALASARGARCSPRSARKASEIWVSFNMNEESDATFQRFVKNINQQPWTPGSGIGPLENPPRTGAIVWKLNYDSNPYFGGKLKMDMEDDLRDDIHLYEHVWLGMPLKISDAIILSGKYTIQTFDDELWRKSDRVLLGEDFGFANDPAAIIRSFMLEEPSKKVPGALPPTSTSSTKPTATRSSLMICAPSTIASRMSLSGRSRPIARGRRRSASSGARGSPSRPRRSGRGAWRMGSLTSRGSSRSSSTRAA
jgi:hypothetical protein